MFASPTTRAAGGLDFSAIGGKNKGTAVPQSLRYRSGAQHPICNQTTTWLKKYPIKC